MNIWSYFSAFSLAMIIFFGIYVSENEQFELISSLKNPFESALDFQESGTIETKIPRDVFTKNGEFFRLYPGTTFDFKEKNRKIDSGEAFLSALFVDNSFFEINDFNIEKGFIQSENVLKTGQINVGPAFINFPGATIFVSRNIQQEKIELYVYGHSVDLFFEGFKYPFVIPAGMKVEIHEKLLSEKTAKLYYSKLKKEFRMSSYNLLDNNNPHIDKINQTIDWQKEWGNRLYNFSINTPKSWIRWKQDNLFGRFIKNFKNFQIKFAFGISEKKKADFQFQNFIEPFFNANNYVLEGEKGAARKELSNFKTIISGNDWNDFMEKNNERSANWEIFSKVQKAWLRTVFTGAMQDVFIEFWESIQEVTNLQKIKGSIFTIEDYIFNNQFKAIQQELFLLKKTLEVTEFNEEDSFEVTKIRRILLGTLKNNFSFQEKESFEVYSMFIEKELSNYEKTEIKQEIRLENGQDLLFFLSDFLRTKADIEIVNILLHSYQKLNIQKIAQKMGRQIFTEKELEIIEIIKLIGETGVSEKDLQKIRDHVEYQRNFNNLIFNFREEKNDIIEETPKRNENLIINVKNLKNFFIELGINTNGMIFKTNRTPNGNLEKALFSEGVFNNKKVSGIFKFQTQLFDLIQVGEHTNKLLNSQFLSNFLTNVELQNINKQEQERTKNKIFISQTTTKAILKRELVREIFSAKKLYLSRDDIKALDLELNNFEIKEAFWQENIKLSFSYNFSTKKIRNASIEKGVIKIDFSNQSINLEQFIPEIKKELKKIENNINEN